MAIRIAIATGEPLRLLGLHAALHGEDGRTVVGRAHTGAECLALVARIKPDVVVLDTRMPDMPAIEIARQIKALHPRTGILGLATHPDMAWIAAMNETGAEGCIVKECEAGALLAAVDAVARGRRCLCPETGACARLYRQSLVDGRLHPLSPRELQVVSKLQRGLSVHEIAGMLAITERMVYHHRRNAMRKLRCKTLLELCRVAGQLGIAPAATSVGSFPGFG